MTKQRHCSLLIATVLTLAMTAMGATRMTVETTKREDGATRIQRYINLNNARINLLYHTRDGKNAINKRWGDHMFGLEFGRVMNGSWSAWQFFCILEWCNVRGQNLCCTGVYLPHKVTAFDVQGVGMADFIYPAIKPGATFRIRMMQFPSHPHWIFVRFLTESFTPWRMDLYLYPGGANDPRDREHWLGTKGGHTNLEIKDIHLTKQDNFIAFYNKYVQNRAGNFLVLQAEDYNDIWVPRANGQGCTIEVRPQEGKHQFYFGLGYFRDQPADKATEKFLTEDAEAIKQFMETIDWEPVIPMDVMTQSCIDARHLDISETILDDFKKKFLEASQKRDTATAATLLEKLEAMKEKKAQDGLKQFR